MSKIIPGDNLTAYQRWELPIVDDQTEQEAEPPTIPGQVDLSQPPLRPLRRATLPTLDEIEQIQTSAHEEGFAAGYQEGRQEGREQGYKKGQQEGHAEGYQSGYGEGLTAARDELLSRAQYLDQILEYLRQPLERLDSTVEEELARLATEIARQLVRRELRTSPGEIVAVVREAVALLPIGNPELELHLHPEDAQLIRDALSMGQDGEPMWKMLEDPSISRGGCVVHTELSRIDATIEKRLGAVIASVLGDGREH